MATIPEILYTKSGVDAAIALALSGFTPNSTTGVPSITDNGDGTFTVVGDASDLVDNGDGTYTVTAIAPALVDNGDGTFTLTGAGATSERTYTKVAVDTALAGKATYPTGGSDGQALVKSGATTAWTTIGSGGTVSDATTTAKGIVQLAGDLAGTAAAPVLKSSLGTSGTVGSSTVIPVITYNNKGLITAIASVTAATAITMTDNSDGTYTLTTSGSTERTYNRAGTDAALTGKVDYPAGGTDGQALVKSGTSTNWATITSSGTVADATSTVKGIVQLAGDLAGTAAAPILKSIVTAGTVGSSTTVPVITYNAKGLITAVSSVSVSAGSSVTLTDNGDGTFTLVAAGVTEQTYSKTAVDSALTGKANYPTGGTDGQAMVKSGTSTAWATITSSGTVPDASTTVKGIVQLAGDLSGTAAAPTLKSIVTANTVGSSTTVPVITFNAKGLVTAASEVAVSGSGGSTPTTNSQAGTAYTVTAADANNIVEATGTGVLTVTIPTNATASMPVGTVIEFVNYGTGSLTISPVSGTVSLRSPNGLRLVTKYATAAARKRATDEWIISGYTTV